MSLTARISQPVQLGFAFLSSGFPLPVGVNGPSGLVVTTRGSEIEMKVGIGSSLPNYNFVDTDIIVYSDLVSCKM